MEDKFYKNYYHDLLERAANAHDREAWEEWEFYDLQAATFALEYHTEIFGEEPDELELS